MEMHDVKANAAETAGAGLLQRSVALLRVLATAGRRGAALTALARHTGLSNSTVHRLLAQLIAERLAMKMEDSKRYALGPLAYELGLAATHQFDIRSLCRPLIERLASEVAETVYLIQRSGIEAVCLDLVEGPTPVRVVTLHVGSRRPLGLGAGGLAILAALGDDEQQATLAQVQERIAKEWNFPEHILRESLQAARETGCSLIRNRITPGVTAVGRSFRDSLGQVLGAISVAGVNARMTKARQASLMQSLTVATRDVERVLGGQSWARYV